jgi:formylglycine-generating enzyme required for sulfatase activity
MRLVTADGTRARRSEAELLADSSERPALEALVRGRIVVANDAQQGAYEIAHEALLTSWATFQEWRRRGAADPAARKRVEQAAEAWTRMGRPHDLLWGRRQLREAAALDRETMSPRDVEFLDAGGRAVKRRRIIGGVGAVLAVAAIAIAVVAIRARARRELERVVASHTAMAASTFDDARRIAKQRDAARDRSFGLFDAGRWPEGEQAWDEVEQLAAQEASRFRAASSAYETALSIDPSRASLRTSFAELLYERLLRAEGDRDRDLVEELAGRLDAYDDGHVSARYRAELAADAHVELEVPAGTIVSIERAPRVTDPSGPASGPDRPPAREPVTATKLALRPGHVVFTFEAPGHASARLPVLLERGATRKISVQLPSVAAIPPGMIYVPPARFLFGSGDSTDLRRGFLNSPPLHEVEIAAYLIARHEVTFGEWIEYLDNLPVDERRKRTPSSGTSLTSSLELTEIAPRRWRLDLKPTTHLYRVETGQRFHYEVRTKRADQDWTRFPVAAISFDDAIAYAAWLDRTRRVPGARLCDEREWEHAARGADGRVFPHGVALRPDDANIDVTYGREPLAFGPDEVGAHPASRSPVGAEDMAGNVWEWTRSVANGPLVRGGGWYNAELSSRTSNREDGEPSQRNVLVGGRICASLTNPTVNSDEKPLP